VIHHERSRDAVVFRVLEINAPDAFGVERVDPRVAEGHQQRRMRGDEELGKLPAPYPELIAMHVPRPIHDRAAYDNPVEIIDALAGHKLNADQEEYLELLSQLVEAYEVEQLGPPSKLSGPEALKFLLKKTSSPATISPPSSAWTAPPPTSCSKAPANSPSSTSAAWPSASKSAPGCS
jgi:hypothetical protein